jgi:hypothetical protein
LVVRWIPAAVAAVTLGVVGSASGEPQPSPFPLAEGNQWTLRDVETNAARTISVGKGEKGLVLSGLPGAPALRVRWSSDAVQAWDTADERWEAILRFGLPARSSYVVRLGNTLLWRNVVVTVASKRARIEDYEGRSRVCTQFTFASKGKIADAGLESLAFARGLGPVRIVEQWIGGVRELALAGHRLK